MRIKSCPVRIKAAGTHEGTDEGVFEAIVAAYNVDSVGDKITPGAFAETLAEWKGRGDPIPVLWSHMSHDPEYHIGEVLEAEERPEGLWVKARIDLDEGTKAARVYKLLKGVETAMDEHITHVREAVDAAIDAKAGRTLSAKNEERVAQIARLAKELLDSLNGSSTEDAEKATPNPPETASPQEPAAKAHSQATPAPASSRLRTDLEVLFLEASTLTD